MKHPYSAAPDRDEKPALPCQTRHPELWFTDDPVDIARAKTLCRACVMRKECLAGAMSRQEEVGIWGGEIFWHGEVVAVRPRRGRPPRHAAASGRTLHAV
ncbi:WhiB family transcriptional regulator [Flexivirga oryzae]|uniref:Transcriptional regulator WhiB n=1 Tax=Flexivirga oryzae TaxID=1794944 RepID=A0A839N8G5_9MICO|nr:WhiB family transcriptional regulator [Flexivirga oryzae]MBB2894060.1 WhiB family redox-sensing transcriptional regulator [Flexivirga oryzae]